MKIWLLACVAVLLGLSTAFGQPLDPLQGGEDEEPSLEAEGVPGRRGVRESGPGMAGRPGFRRGGPGKMRPRLREFRDNIKNVKAELDLITREIGEQARKLRELRDNYMASGDEKEKAAIEKEMRGVMEKLSRYEILLAEKKVEISKKAYERALDRYVRAKVELEGAPRKSKHRLKRLERGLVGEPPFSPGPPPGGERPAGEGEPLPDA